MRSIHYALLYHSIFWDKTIAQLV